MTNETQTAAGADTITIDEYRKHAKRTRMDLPDDDWREYLYDGAIGELGELLELLKKIRWHGHAFDRDRVCEELGDALWYLAQLYEGTPYRYKIIIDYSVRQARIFVHVIMFALLCRESDGKQMLDTFAALVNTLGFTFDEVANHNIEKLKKRYPDGFSKQASRERVM